MKYHDDVYGSQTIEEPVLLALMQSEPLQRLRGVMQHGITGLMGITEPVTRFDHSVGTMLLVRRMGGNLQEQIAALLHDVSHTAFSHVIDYVFDGHDSQSYHEEVKEVYVQESDLPGLLATHGYRWRDFLHDAQYTRLEQPMPHLCADRLDYFLRDSPGLGLATRAEVQDLLRHLTVHDERIVVDDVDAARWLAYTFMEADEASWANFREVGLYELTARAIRRALQIGLLTESEFWGVDQAVWEKLHSTQDRQLRMELSLISPQTTFVWDENNPTFVISTKLRSVDPDVLLADGELVPLSQVDTSFAAHRQAYLQRKQGLWPMRVVPAGEEGVTMERNDDHER